MKLPEEFARFSITLPVAAPGSGPVSADRGGAFALGWRLSGSEGLELRAPADGLLHFEHDVLSLVLSRIEGAGPPEPIDSEMRRLWQLQPQLLPLPRAFLFQIDQFMATGELAQAAFNAWLFSALGPPFGAIDGPGAKAIDRRGRAVEPDASLVDAFLAGEIDLQVRRGAEIASVGADQPLSFGAEDLHNYAAHDQPRAVLGDPLGEAVTPPSDARPTFACAASHCDASGAPDHDARDLSATIRQESGRVIFEGSDLLGEEAVYLRYETGDEGPKEGLFGLDRFEKWARFPARPEHHLKSWIRSGIADFPGEALEALVAPLYPEHHTEALEDFPSRGERLRLPEPMMISTPTETGPDRFDGEQGGLDRPTYAGFDAQRTVFRLVKRTRENNDDDFHNAPWRDLGDVRYRGVVGLENYVKRVIACEYHLTWGGQGHDLGTWERKRHGLMVQALAARSYVLSRWLSGSSDLENPWANDFAEQKLKDGASFQVHRLDKLNHHVRTEETRVAVEDAIAETWGMVITHRGRFVDAEYYAGDVRENASCANARKDYIVAVRTPFGVDCEQAVSGSKYASSFGHGRGFSQKGSRLYSARGASYIQIAHAYFSGIHLRNGWGTGDFITRPSRREILDDPDNWLVNGHATVSDEEVSAHSGNWRCSVGEGTVSESDEFNWYLSHNFRAHEFCGEGENAHELNLSPDLMRMVQETRSRLGKAVRVVSVDEGGASIRLKSGSQGLAEAAGRTGAPRVEEHSAKEVTIYLRGA